MAVLLQPITQVLLTIKSVPLITNALDVIQKIVAHPLLSRQHTVLQSSILKDSPAENAPVADVLVDLVCDCFANDFIEEKLHVYVIKVISWLSA
jgi:hypothetical protein